MIRFSIHLPTKYRLDIKLVKNRKDLDENPFDLDMGKILRVKKGSKISRFFKLIFENKKLKKLIISYFAAIIYVSSFAPVQAELPDEEVKPIIQAPLVLNTETGIQFPLEEVRLTQSYSVFHRGIDLDGITGDPIYPIMSGTVEKVEYSKLGYGKSVLVSHGNLKSLYAHLSFIEVKEGQEVTKSTRLGKVGATGWSRGDHLHLEIYDNGNTINPLSILSN